MTQVSIAMAAWKRLPEATLAMGEELCARYVKHRSSAYKNERLDEKTMKAKARIAGFVLGALAPNQVSLEAANGLTDELIADYRERHSVPERTIPKYEVERQARNGDVTTRTFEAIGGRAEAINMAMQHDWGFRVGHALGVTVFTRDLEGPKTEVGLKAGPDDYIWLGEFYIAREIV